MRGESKEIEIEFDARILGNNQVKLLVEPYNDPVKIEK